MEEHKRLVELIRPQQGFELCQLKLAKWVLSLFEADERGWIVAPDRTEWAFGRQQLNVMMLGVVYQGLTLPLVWRVLDKDGHSHTD
ncbi:hypothetical protein J3L12_14630, partial [Meiothermus sp. CFH 77666]|nr:hypothetical protein [Meiothermus sp. CFH 77666]